MILDEELLKDKIADILVYKREIEALLDCMKKSVGETKEAYRMVLIDKVWKMEKLTQSVNSDIFTFCVNLRIEINEC